jgi:adenylyltransferase/sulfurtransferase
MFSISAAPLDPQALRATVRNVQAGGYASFEGWIRDHNEGKAVTALEYEAYEAVCITEGNAILADAMKRFGVLEARCVHRVGALDLEEIAVWVGVSAAHRGEAFDACRYIIDAVKHRLPIWKKEHYADGNSGWVNCERCAHVHVPTPALTEGDFYARQVNLKEVGAAGQDKLRQARVLIVGAGGLGSPAALYLAAAGISHLGLCERDTVDATNLHRQILFDAGDVGKSKALRARDRLAALNPFIDVTVHEERLGPHNVDTIVAGYDVLVDGTDNFETKFLLNDAAVRHGKVLVQASIYQYEGQLFVYHPTAGGPCLRCIWPEVPEPGCVGSCAEAGVLGAVPGVFGSLQAMEVLKQLLNLPGRLQGETLFFDLLSLQSRKVRGVPDPDCPVCGARATPVPCPWGEAIELELEDYLRAPDRYALIDIRETGERALHLPEAALALPGSCFPLDSGTVDLPEPWVLCCARGVRSRYLAMALRKAGRDNVFSLVGGAEALSRWRSASHAHPP